MDAFWSLYKHLIKLLTSDADLLCKGLTIDALDIDFMPQDKQFLLDTNILDIYHGFMFQGSSKSDKYLRVLGRIAFRYLAIQSLTIEENDSLNEIGELKKRALETIVSDLEKSIESLHQKRRQLGQTEVAEEICTYLYYLFSCLHIFSDENYILY